MSKFLLIQNLKVHNANALSSAYTIGFPAMTAWLGFMHALERKLHNSEFSDVKFTGIIVSCLDINLHTYRGKGDYTASIIATSNPLDKTGKRPSFIEEARCDLEVSIAIEYKIGMIDNQRLNKLINQKLHSLKLASGDILTFKECTNLEADNNEPHKLTRYLMPGFCLISRQDLMTKAMQSGENAIDALLDYLKVSTNIEINEKHKIKKSNPSRKEKGWIVPIMMGYQGISPLAKIKNGRDETTPHRFAESIISLGEFKMPYHFDDLEQMIWRYQTDQENNLYLCQNNYIKNTQESKL